MIDILCPRACNQDKFTDWFSVGPSLGLIWDLDKLELSMAPAKISKAIRRIEDMLAAATTTKKRLNELLGSLRQVAKCIRVAVSFFQRVAALQRTSSRS